MVLDFAESEAYAGTVCLSVFGVAGIILNVCETYVIIRKYKRASCFEMVLLSLGCADIFTAIIFLAFGIMLGLGCISQKCGGHTKKVLPQLHIIVRYMKYVAAFGIFSSWMHVAFITIDRYLAVAYPLWHKISVTRLRVGLVLGGLWILVTSITIVFGRVTNAKVVGYIFAVMNVSIIICMVIAYYFIVRKFRRSQLSRARGNIKATDPTAGESTKGKKEHLVILNSVAVTLCFAICSAPMSVHILLDMKNFLLTFSFIFALNSVMDPVIYFLFSYYRKRQSGQA